MKITDFIIAEDVRFELGNKLSIMGVFNEELSIDPPEDVQWPIMFKLAAYIRIDSGKSNKTPDHFKFKAVYDNNNIATMDGGFGAEKPTKIIIIPVIMFPFPIPGYGPIDFVFEIFSHEKVLATQTQTIRIQKEVK